MASSASLQRAAFFNRSCGSANIFWLEANDGRADASDASIARADALRNRHVAMVCALMPIFRCDAFCFFPPLLQEFTP
ncbi:hypothetical protein [Xanthomonas oryzae]|uniref:hypothetical protein n=1 Tax=Xanthomonas oryzae TaxID=347 RepID=UPI000ACF73D3|nr:hypothetical protein [Xanthomonas oryzae]